MYPTIFLMSLKQIHPFKDRIDYRIHTFSAFHILKRIELQLVSTSLSFQRDICFCAGSLRRHPRVETQGNHCCTH